MNELKKDLKTIEAENLLYEQLTAHKGHHVEIVSYGDCNDPACTCLECLDCNEIILDAELYDLVAVS